MKKHLSTILLILVFLIGLSLLLYPTISDYVNSKHQSRAITKYAEAVSAMDQQIYQEMWQEAADYNAAMAEQGTVWQMSAEAQAEYDRTLDVDGNGMMGYIEITKLHCSLPIYHGTEEGTLLRAIGHLPGSSLPVGGQGSHCVLSGHRGLPSAKLFSELDRLALGDRFVLRTLDQELTYEVDQILIVLPDEVDALTIQPGLDLCTLVTCTPYGVNSHRLLVRGHRVENTADAAEARVTADAIQIEPAIVAPLMAAPVLVVLAVAVLTGSRKKRK